MFTYNNTIACKKEGKTLYFKNNCDRQQPEVETLITFLTSILYKHIQGQICSKSWLKQLCQMVACLTNYGNCISLRVFSLTHSPTSTNRDTSTIYLCKGEEVAKYILEAIWVAAYIKVYRSLALAAFIKSSLIILEQVAIAKSQA